jgi:DNA repair protein RecO (recombination protein O)
MNPVLLLTDEAYVLQTLELGETDLIVSLITRDHGKLRGVARAARRSRRRFGGALEPLTLVRVAWSEREGRELHRLESMDVLRSYAAMQREPGVQAACAVISEVSEAFSREGQSDDKAFRLIGSVLEALERGCETFAAVRYFEYWMLRIHGLFPEVNACARCGKELPRRHPRRVDAHGRIHCTDCSNEEGSASRRLSAPDLHFLESARTQPPGSVVAEPRAVAAGGAVEALLRGTLESYAERRFRAYRHLRAAGDGTESEAGT